MYDGSSSVLRAGDRWYLSMSFWNSSFRNRSYSSGRKGWRRLSSGRKSKGASVTMVASQ